LELLIETETMRLRGRFQRTMLPLVMAVAIMGQGSVGICEN